LSKRQRGYLYILSIELDWTLKIVIDMPSMLAIEQKKAASFKNPL
jgi:hypothetical protein